MLFSKTEHVWNFREKYIAHIEELKKLKLLLLSIEKSTGLEIDGLDFAILTMKVIFNHRNLRQYTHYIVSKF